MDSRFLGLGIGVLFFAGVVGFAVVSDDGDADGGFSVATGDVRVIEPPTMPPIEIDPDQIPDIDRDFEFPEIPDGPRPELRFPTPEPVEPMRPPDMRMPDMPHMQPAPAYPSPGPGGGEASDCGFPSGYDENAARRDGGNAHSRVAVHVNPCHSYDGESVRVIGTFEGNSAVQSVKFVFGDGRSFTVEGHSDCADAANRSADYGAPPHTYAQPGRYTVTATFSYTRCDGDKAQESVSVSIPVYRDAGPRPG